MKQLKPIFKFVAGFFIPHSVVCIVKTQRRKQNVACKEAERATLLQEYRSRSGTAHFDYGKAVAFLTQEGVDEHHVRDGSMPEASLAFCAMKLGELLGTKKPLIGLHVGNFVGVSLGAFTEAARSLHAESFVLAVDPNIPHRGVSHPQDKVAKLLSFFGLQNHVLLTCGYTMKKSFSNDDVVIQNYDPRAAFVSEFGFENVLPKLAALCPQQFDFAVIDGNHEQGYLEKELQEVAKLLRPGGVLIVDDVSEHWFGVKAAFEKFAKKSTVKVVGEDGRVGIVQLQ